LVLLENSAFRPLADKYIFSLSSIVKENFFKSTKKIIFNSFMNSNKMLIFGQKANYAKNFSSLYSNFDFLSSLSLMRVQKGKFRRSKFKSPKIKAGSIGYKGIGLLKNKLFLIKNKEKLTKKALLVRSVRVLKSRQLFKFLKKQTTFLFVLKKLKALEIKLRKLFQYKFFRNKNLGIRLVNKVVFLEKMLKKFYQESKITNVSLKFSPLYKMINDQLVVSRFFFKNFDKQLLKLFRLKKKNKRNYFTQITSSLDKLEFYRSRILRSSLSKAEFSIIKNLEFKRMRFEDVFFLLKTNFDKKGLVLYKEGKIFRQENELLTLYTAKAKVLGRRMKKVRGSFESIKRSFFDVYRRGKFILFKLKIGIKLKFKKYKYFFRIWKKNIRAIKVLPKSLIFLYKKIRAYENAVVFVTQFLKDIKNLVSEKDALNFYSKKGVLGFEFLKFYYSYKSLFLQNSFVFWSNRWLNGALSNFYGLRKTYRQGTNKDFGRIRRLPDFFVLLNGRNKSEILKEVLSLKIPIVGVSGIEDNPFLYNYSILSNTESNSLLFFYFCLMLESAFRGFLLESRKLLG
jgi:hypothetical protein